MLVLSRKVGERIQIGDNITIVVNRIAGNRVTIGVEAPAEMRIVRSELEAALNAESADEASDKVMVPAASTSRISERDFLPTPLSAFRRPR